jgi:hypothetical protein
MKVLSDSSSGTVAEGIAGMTATVILKHKNSLTRPGIVLAPKPIIVITNADTRLNGKIKSAMY